MHGIADTLVSLLDPSSDSVPSPEVGTFLPGPRPYPWNLKKDPLKTAMKHPIHDHPPIISIQNIENDD